MTEDTQTHYMVEVGPVKNSSAGLWTDMCFTTKGVAIQAGRATLGNIERGRNKRGDLNPTTRHEEETYTVLAFNGEDSWKSTVHECTRGSCHVRTRLPRALTR